MKPHGHYCKICGEYKANEKFSGKGHAAHICKACQSLSVEERNKEAILTRMMNLPFHLSKEQISWLKKHRKDKRPEVSEAAKAVFTERFPMVLSITVDTISQKIYKPANIYYSTYSLR